MKLIDLLVKELPSLGGWPDGVTHIEQDYDRELMFYGRGDVRTGVILNELAIDHRKCGEVGEKITRDQYESALAASKSVVGHDGWIQWAGGKCPVDSDAIVEVKFRSPNLYQYNNDRAGDFSWAHDGIDGDIIAYRLHKLDAKSRANDDRLEQDLNECIGQSVAAEWDGDGLPPVGVECEFKCATGEWVAVEITAIARNGVCFVERGKNGENYVPFRCEFRPLRNEAERKRESAAKEMARYANSDQHRKFNAGLRNCLSIYDAIAAGKIPGVKLESK